MSVKVYNFADSKQVPAISGIVPAYNLEESKLSNSQTPLAINTIPISEYKSSIVKLEQDEEPVMECKTLIFIILGISGDLAKKKIIPSLFKLFKAKILPHQQTNIVGVARTDLDIGKYLQSNITLDNTENDNNAKMEFIKRFHYFRVTDYSDSQQWKSLNEYCHNIERNSCCCTKKPVIKKDTNNTEKNPENDIRVFYFSLPPSVFLNAADMISKYCLGNGKSFTRLVLEKPFGHDLISAKELDASLQKIISEEKIFRIDHYLGKEVLINLMILRFGNLVFDIMWARYYIQCVIITFKEKSGIGTRGKYFDRYGIIRDVMQNHLMQILSLVAMEPPATMSASDVSTEKIKVLRSIHPISNKEIVIGQYSDYLNELDVSPNSLTPTYACAGLQIKNGRWDGIPFILKTGKELDENKAEIRIQFKSVPGCIFNYVPRNELVVNIQPNRSIYLKANSKVPGFESNLAQVELDLTLPKRFKQPLDVDAYERLLLDVVRGDHGLFVTKEEIEQEWRIFSPILKELEENKVKPIIYQRGSRSFPQADEFIERHSGYQRNVNYDWKQ